MHRFFINVNDIDGKYAKMTGDDVMHISKVLRLGPGDEISVCDGNSNEYRARILDVGKRFADLELLECERIDTEPVTSVTVYQGIPKAGKLETIIQKCTEVGAVRIVPFDCERAVAKPWSADDSKAVRYQRVAYEAAKQSGRGVVPTVEAPIAFKELAARVAQHGCSVLFWEEERDRALCDVPFDANDVAIVIGPEGGITPFEARELVKAGAVTASLGKRILRTETAGVVAAALILYERDDMRP